MNDIMEILIDEEMVNKDRYHKGYVEGMEQGLSEGTEQGIVKGIRYIMEALKE